MSKSCSPSAAESELALRTLQNYREALYARVDLLYAEDQSLLVSELELIEPSLFLKQNPSALQELIQGANRLASGHVGHH